MSILGYKCTKHFLQAMRERNVAIKEIINSIIHGRDFQCNENKYGKRQGKKFNNIFVVMNIETKELVTVYVK